MSHIYHERQLGGLCGVHCLNNLLQGPHFGPGDLAEIGVQLDQEELLLFGGSSGAAAGLPSPSIDPSAPNDPGASPAAGSTDRAAAAEPQAYNVDSSADGGNFSIQVLTIALKRSQLEVLPSKHPHAREAMKDPASACDAFMLQYRDHWFAVRKVADCWWNLNSTRKKPAMVSPFYLAAWLGQLQAEGYTVFLVMGDRWPEAARPQDESKPEENFHEIFELLEDGKKSGGNPLAGGEENDDDVIIPPDPEEDAAIARRLAAEDDNGSRGGLYNELLHAQRHMQRGAPVPQSRSSHQGGLDWGLPGQVPNNDGWSWQSIWDAFQGSSPAAASSSSAPPPPRRNTTDADRLSDMGFREPQIRVAQELTRGKSSSSALQLLVGAAGHDQVPTDGKQIARDIQEAVLGLDTDAHAAFGERLLRLVSLLCLEQASLEAAQPHLSSDALAEFVRTLLRNRKAWPAESHGAADIVVQLLLTYPTGASTMEAGARRGRQAPTSASSQPSRALEIEAPPEISQSWICCIPVPDCWGEPPREDGEGAACRR